MPTSVRSTEPTTPFRFCPSLQPTSTMWVEKKAMKSKIPCSQATTMPQRSTPRPTWRGRSTCRPWREISPFSVGKARAAVRRAICRKRHATVRRLRECPSHATLRLPGSQFGIQTFCQSVPFHHRFVLSLMTRQVWPFSSVPWLATVGSAGAATGSGLATTGSATA